MFGPVPWWSSYFVLKTEQRTFLWDHTRLLTYCSLTVNTALPHGIHVEGAPCGVDPAPPRTTIANLLITVGNLRFADPEKQRCALGFQEFVDYDQQECTCGRPLTRRAEDL
jgi:hypothetical protein